MPNKVLAPVRSIGILTGGGDVPGLNPAIKALVYRADGLGIRVVGLRAGWEGITLLDRNRSLDELTFRYDDPDSWEHGYVMPLSRLTTHDIDRQGGTILQSSRTNPQKVRVDTLPPHLKRYAEGRSEGERVDLTDEIIANLDFLNLDGLVVIGGDDTLSAAINLGKRGVPVWGIPKTMDNDVPGTEYCLGFQTAISRATEYINRIRSTANSHHRTALFRIFGRDAGFTALETAITAWVDRVLIPEVPVKIDRLAELIAHDRRNPQQYSTVIMAEGANLGVPVPEIGPADAYGHRKKANVAEFLADELAPRLKGVEFLTIDLTYLLRSGEPEVYDKHMAIYFANLIMNMVENGEHGVMAAYRNGDYIVTDIPGKDFHARRVDPIDYHTGRYRPRFENITGRYLPQVSTEAGKVKVIH